MRLLTMSIEYKKLETETVVRGFQSLAHEFFKIFGCFACWLELLEMERVIAA
jgi:hypothetical protein